MGGLNLGARLYLDFLAMVEYVSGFVWLEPTQVCTAAANARADHMARRPTAPECVG